MSDVLAAWLLEQIDADEAVLARRAVEWFEIKPYGGGLFEGDSTLRLSTEIADILVNPARVLAECEAKRRIVDVHASTHECPSVEDTCGWWEPGLARFDSDTGKDVIAPHCPTLRLLASVYADRPGYNESWRP